MRKRSVQRAISGRAPVVVGVLVLGDTIDEGVRARRAIGSRVDGAFVSVRFARD
jgi:hypothetical protein